MLLIKPVLMQVLEAAINRYLALGDNVEAVLAPLVGKVIALTILPFNETVYLCPHTSGIQLLDQLSTEPDTTLSGSLMAFGAMGLSETPMRAIFAGKVTITGDTQVGHHFQRLFAKLDVNLQSHLAKFTGDDLASKITQFLDNTREWGLDSVQALKLNSAEFLQEETRDLPAPGEADMLFEQIDELRHDYDRLQARMQRLQTIIATQSP